MKQHIEYLQLLEPFISYLVTQRCVAHNTALAYRRDVEQFLNYWQSSVKKQKRVAKKTGPTKPYDLSSVVLTKGEALREVGNDIRMILIDFRDFLRKEGVGSRSISRKLSALRAFFRYVSTSNTSSAIAEHDVSLIVGLAPRLERRLPRVCSPDDIEKLLQVARKEKNAVQAELICYLLYTAGLRVSELVSIRRENIQIAIGHITLQGKGGKMRTIPLIPQACRAVERYDDYLKSHKNGSENPTKLQRSRGYINLSRQTVWRLIRSLARKAGLSIPVSPHVLRHSLATHSLENGWDLRSLQLMLGHERIATTEMYIHLNTKFVKSEYKKRHPRG
jgi:integrase/recombinase XerD